MDPERYYKYSDLGTIDNPKGKTAFVAKDQASSRESADAASNTAAYDLDKAVKPTEFAFNDSDTYAGGAIAFVYNLDQLSTNRPGPVLAAGYGNQLKAVVKAAVNADVRPLYTTGTDDKLRAFSFGNSATVLSIGKKFNEKLFHNEYAILSAMQACGARTVLWAQPTPPSALFRIECERHNVLLLTQMSGDKTGNLWERAESDDAAKQRYASRIAENVDVDWRKCPHCGLYHDNADASAHQWKCPSCGKLYRLSSDERIAITFDEGSFVEWDTDVAETDPMGYPDYRAVLERAHERSGYDEAVRCGRAKIMGHDAAVAIMEPAFMMGSMGSVVGEKITRMIERATAESLPVVIFCASGGARMQEGLASLMQMAKISAAIEAHDRAGLLYISVLTDPTTGGVTASFAMLGDIILSEPGALIGFAGRRVIQDTIKQALPDDFQTAEFALEHGLIDAIVDRLQLRQTIAQILEMHRTASQQDTRRINDQGGLEVREAIIPEMPAVAASADAPVPSPDTSSTPSDAAEPASVAAAAAVQDDAAATSIDGEGAAPEEPAIPGWMKNMPSKFKDLFGELTNLADSVGKTVSEQTSNATLWWALRNQGVADAPYMKPATASKLGAKQADAPAEENRAWESVQLARNAHRPTSSFYIAAMVDDFIELHGDRAYADDGAIIGGIGKINGQPVTIIAEEKGSNLKERIARNFGSPKPEGYRKAQRLMRQADKFGRPIVCFVDTQGAYCGTDAEERGMGNAIAESLALMAGLNVPVVSVVIGEGGSGGALALAVSNRVAMQENAVYSVLSPEGFASILWKDGSRAPEAASVMKMSAAEAFDMGMIEDVIPEGQAPAHENPDQAAAAIWIYITNALSDLSKMSPEELRTQRYTRFRSF